jgi:hypothetical protein
MAPRMKAPTVQNCPNSSSTSNAMMTAKIPMKTARILYSATKKADAPSSTLLAMCYKLSTTSSQVLKYGRLSSSFLPIKDWR